MSRGEVQGARVEVGRGRRGWRAAAACSAWMPEPVPRSSARRDGRPDGDAGEGGGRAADAEHHGRRVHARAADAAGAADGAAQVGDDAPVLAVGPAVRPDVHGRARTSSAVADEPAVGQARRPAGQHVRARRACGTGCCSRNSRTRRLQRASAAGGAQRGHGLAARQRRVGGGAEQVEQPSAVKEAAEQRVARAGRHGRAAGSGTCAGRGWRYSRTPIVARRTRGAAAGPAQPADGPDSRREASPVSWQPGCLAIA